MTRGSTAILMPASFFLAVWSAYSERPDGAIRLIYVRALRLAVSVLILGVGLVHASAY